MVDAGERMARWLGALCLTILLTFAPPSWGGEPLKVLLLPYTNTMALMKLNQPIRQALETHLGIPVILFTSANFEAHFDDIRHGNFDVAITGPHFGAWAVMHGHRPLLRYRPSLSPLLAVRKDGGITRPEQLRGKVVALSDALSSSSLGGQRWLAELGLSGGKDYQIMNSPSHTTAIMAVALGQADAAITTHTPIKQAAPEIAEQLRLVVSPFAMPHLFTIANQSLPADQAEKIKAALQAFQNSESGQSFMTSTGYLGYVELTPADVEAMRPVVSMLLTVTGAPAP